MKRYETLETIKVGTYIYNTYSTGKENVVVITAIEEKGGKKFAVGTRNGVEARFEIKVNSTFNYEYFVPMNKRGRVQSTTNVVWEHHRVKDDESDEIIDEAIVDMIAAEEVERDAVIAQVMRAEIAERKQAWEVFTDGYGEDFDAYFADYKDDYTVEHREDGLIVSHIAGGHPWRVVDSVTVEKLFF